MVKEFAVIQEAVSFIRNKVDVENVKKVNDGRHRAIESTDGTRYWLLYKREFFQSYGYQFEGESGYGESINKEILQEAIANDFDYLLFAYEDGKIYSIDPVKVRQYAELNETIRETKGGEETYSFSIDELYRWDNKDINQVYTMINADILEEKLEEYGELMIRFDSGEDRELHLHNTEFLDDLVKVEADDEIHWFNPEKIERFWIHEDF